MRGVVEDDEKRSKRMGGVEDDETPPKRPKVSIEEEEQGSCSLSHSITRLLTSEAVKVELVHIVAEALNSLGYSKTGACLEEESGIPLNSVAVDSLVRQVLEGQWDESLSTLHKIGLVDETVIKLASFAILEQKYFELLAEGKVMECLKTLRAEITPLCVNDARVKKMSFFLLCPSQNLLDGTKLDSRKNVLGELSELLLPTTIIARKRLLDLIEQALVLRKDLSTVGNIPMPIDHRCGRNCIPTQRLQVAPDGHVSLKHRLCGHQKPVSCISWSPDDDQLLTCGVEEVMRRWDIASGQCLQIYEKSGLGLISCAWAPDGKSIFSGVNDKSIRMWDLEGKELECWNGQATIRIPNLGVASNGKRLISLGKENMILLFRWESNSEKLIVESQIITSFLLSDNGKLLLVSLLNEELDLWSIDGRAKRVAKYRSGRKCSCFVMRPCFGGFENAFIASGSEDSQVYIWDRLSKELILTLPGHSGAVNCVSWNPVNPHMLASASDDRTICIWGLNQEDMNCNG